MSKNTSVFSDLQADSLTAPLPSFTSKEAVEAYLKGHGNAWADYLLLPANIKQEFMNFCMGKHGLKITYDTVFKKIFDTANDTGLKRLESLLSAILDRAVKIIRIMPREGTQMNENASFVVMDILVQLDDMSFANVEMQKIGYNFPLARADCYVSDIIMRQYVTARSQLGNDFSFNNLHKVYSIILMERSPMEFHTVKETYIHKRIPSFDTGIYKMSPGIHEDIFICLDSFHSIVHNITKESNILDAWLTFLSATDPETIKSLISAFPIFASIYQEIADFTMNPEELINMLSKELYIMDKNMERLMVAELHEEVLAAKDELNTVTAKLNIATAELDIATAELDAVITERDNAVTERDNAVTERDIFKLRYQDRTPEEIAEELQLSLEYVNSVLNT